MKAALLFSFIRKSLKSAVAASGFSSLFGNKVDEVIKTSINSLLVGSFLFLFIGGIFPPCARDVSVIWLELL